MSTLAELLSAIEDGRDSAARDAAWSELTRIAHAFVRARMGGPDRRAAESMDVVNSVLGSLAIDLRERRLSLEDDAHLRRYLNLAVRRKLSDLGRHRRAEKRGGGHVHEVVGDVLGAGVDPLDPRASAGVPARTREMEARAASRLTPNELAAWQLFVDDRSWTEIGAALGVSADAARHRLARLRERLAAPDRDP